jgi:hypothetical protein
VANQQGFRPQRGDQCIAQCGRAQWSGSSAAQRVEVWSHRGPARRSMRRSNTEAQHEQRGRVRGEATPRRNSSGGNTCIQSHQAHVAEISGGAVNSVASPKAASSAWRNHHTESEVQSVRPSVAVAPRRIVRRMNQCSEAHNRPSVEFQARNSVVRGSAVMQAQRGEAQRGQVSNRPMAEISAAGGLGRQLQRVRAQRRKPMRRSSAWQFSGRSAAQAQRNSLQRVAEVPVAKSAGSPKWRLPSVVSG